MPFPYLMPRFGPHHDRLLQTPAIRRWHQNVSQGSPITADVNLRRLGAFCIQMRTTPENLLKLKEERLHNLFLDFVNEETKKGRTGSYIKSTLTAVRSWLAHNGIQVRRPVKVKGAQATPTLQDERVPTQEELHRIFLSATPKERVACALMAHSGVRPEVIGNYLGNDGLRLKDIPELHVEGKLVTFQTTPAMIVIRPELSKARNKYFTFLSDEGCSYVRDYLEQRLSNGERLEAGSALVTPNVKVKEFIRTTNVCDGIRRAIRTASFQWRPYVLRGYFDTQLLMAESKGKVAHDYRVFWMGHKGSMEARYTTNKGRLPSDLVNDMRDAYRRCLPFLETTSTTSREDVPKQVAIAMLQLAGFDEEEIEKMDLNDLAAIRDQVRDRLGASSGPTQEVVPIGEVSQRLAARWQFVAALGPTQAIVTSPSSPRTPPTPAVSALPLRAAASPVPPAGQSAVGGSRVGGEPASSVTGGPSSTLPLPPRASGQLGEAHSVGVHRLEPHRGSPEEDSPGQS